MSNIDISYEPTAEAKSKWAALCAEANIEHKNQEIRKQYLSDDIYWRIIENVPRYSYDETKNTLDKMFQDIQKQKQEYNKLKEENEKLKEKNEELKTSLQTTTSYHTDKYELFKEEYEELKKENKKLKEENNKLEEETNVCNDCKKDISFCRTIDSKDYCLKCAVKHEKSIEEDDE